MINGVKRGFGYTFGKYLLLFLIAVVVGLVAHFFKVDLRSVFIARVHAVEIDNSIIATSWNKFYKDSSSSNSTSTYFYSPKIFYWSEQYNKFNWYFWETTYNLSERVQIFKDWITSRSNYSYISDNNDIDFFINCSAVFNNYQIHNSSTLVYGYCNFIPFINGGDNVSVSEFRTRINGTVNSNINNNTYIDSYVGYNFVMRGNNNATKYVEFARVPDSTYYYNYFNLTDGFFTTPVSDLTTYLGSINVRDRRGVTGGLGNVGLSRLYYTSVPKINGILNSYYPWDSFVYQSDINITFDTSSTIYYSFSSNESESIQNCHIVNGSNSCDSDFVFKSYLDYLNDDGEVNQDENGNVDVTTTTQTEIDYTSNINSINSNIIDSNIDTPNDITSWLDSDESQFLPSNFVNTITTFIDGLSSQTCTPIQTTLLGESYTLPCISSIIWVHVPNLELLYQTIVSGLIIYYLIFYNFKTINNSLDPLYDRIEVIKL